MLKFNNIDLFRKFFITDLLQTKLFQPKIYHIYLFPAHYIGINFEYLLVKKRFHKPLKLIAMRFNTVSFHLSY